MRDELSSWVVAVGVCLALGCASKDSTGRGDAGDDGGRDAGIDGDSGLGRDGSIADGGGDGDVRAELKTIASEAAAAICMRIFRCCDATERANDLGVEGTETECRVATAAELEGELLEVAPLIEAGRVRLNRDAVAGCVAALAPASCADDPRDSKDQCEAIGTGVVEVGRPCNGRLECASGQCEQPDSLGERVCVARAEPGASCADVRCADGLYCNTAARCVSIPGLGQPCDLVCADALVCVDGTCAERKAPGLDCTNPEECVFGVCSDGLCVELCANR